MSELVATTKSSLRLLRKLCDKNDTARESVHGLTSADASLGESAAGLQFLVVGNTLLYRHLAMTRVFEDDRAMEIGCSYGHATGLFGCESALGVDHAPEKVEEAGRTYPRCRFVCGDVFGEDLSWLDRDITVLFLDIGGGRNYKPVMKALAICIPLMPALRFVVAKSIEVRNFLLKFEDSVDTVARDLTVSKDDDAETAKELAIDIRRRGGEVPVSLINLLRCGPRLRYLVGKQRMLAFLRGQAPLLQLVEVSSGPPEQRLRVRAAPGEVPAPPAYALAAVRQELAKKLLRQLQNGQEWAFLAIFGRLQRSFYRRFLAVVADAELHRQASDPALDDRKPEPWSEMWLSSAALRHLHAFLQASPEFQVVGSTAGEVPTISEFYDLRVVYTGEPSTKAAAAGSEAEVRTDLLEGQRVVLQVMHCKWRRAAAGGEDKDKDKEAATTNATTTRTKQGDPEVQDLIVERAWVLLGGQVIEQLTSHESDAADVPKVLSTATEVLSTEDLSTAN
ncbi:unnamed protein product [Polarella glacialis]|uniref:Uncharacterized protein n=1 Tax=Polarella glacialis TaxID=89957 RepID=A0A813FN69_POLGL|nr:unnamed protein product [Polarella glacialis]